MTVTTVVARPGLWPSLGGLTGRNLLLYRRSPAALVGAVAFPLVFFGGFALVLWRMLETRGISPGQYLPPAIVVQSMMLTAISSATVLASDAGSGLLSRLRVMSVPRVAVISGRALADGMRSLLSLAIVVVIGLAAGMRFERGVLAGLAFVGLALLFSLTVSAGAGAVGLRLADAEATSRLLGLPGLPLLMLSTAFVPVDQFPGWLAPIVAWSPISATIDGLRALITDGASLTPLWRALGWQAVLLPLFLALAARACRRAS